MLPLDSSLFSFILTFIFSHSRSVKYLSCFFSHTAILLHDSQQLERSLAVEDKQRLKQEHQKAIQKQDVKHDAEANNLVLLTQE